MRQKGPDRYTGALRGLGQQIEIELVIAVLEKDPLTPVAPLNDVMRDVGKDDARKAGHDA